MLIPGVSLKVIIETALMTIGRSISIEEIRSLFEENNRPSKKEVLNIFEEITNDCINQGYELKRLSDGSYRYQVRPELSPWISKLFEGKPPKLSKTLLETLAIIIYKQPITRAEIEAIRGVAVSTITFRTLLDKDWIKIVAYKDLPGKPAVYGTTQQFLDYFNLTSLDDLPTIDELNRLASEERLNRKDEESSFKPFSQLELVNGSENFNNKLDEDSNNLSDIDYRTLETATEIA